MRSHTEWLRLSDGSIQSLLVRVLWSAHARSFLDELP